MFSDRQDGWLLLLHCKNCLFGRCSFAGVWSIVLGLGIDNIQTALISRRSITIIGVGQIINFPTSFNVLPLLCRHGVVGCNCPVSSWAAGGAELDLSWHTLQTKR